MQSCGGSTTEFQRFYSERVPKLIASISNPEVFRQLFQCVSKFVEKVHFDINQEGMRIRSIDPDDFCYVDVFLKRSFFGDYLFEDGMKFGLDVSKLSKVLPKIYKVDSLDININGGFLELFATKKWKTVFRIKFLEEDPFDLAEPKRFRYQTFAEIPAEDFSNLVDAASAVSNEMKLSVEKDNPRFFMSAKSGDYFYVGEPSEIIRIKNKDGQNVSASVITNYIKALGPLIKQCKTVRVRLGADKPVRLDLVYQDRGVFSFILSHRRRKTGPVSKRGGMSLPRLTVTKLPEFLLYLSNTPEGEENRFLKAAGLETSGGDYTRMSKQLGLAYHKKGRIKLTREGALFVNLTQNDLKQAREFLHKLALSKYEAYRVMIDSLKDRPLAPDELFGQITAKSKIDKQDLSTLLGLAIWCGVVDRKLALYYFGGKRE